MPTLNWIGKEAVVNHDKVVPFRLFRKVKTNSVEKCIAFERIYAKYGIIIKINHLSFLRYKII